MSAAFNPFRYLKLAAQGNLEAQRELAEGACHLFAEDGDLQALLDGLCFARLAAAHGEAGDAGRLLAMLALAGNSHMTEKDAELRFALAAETIATVARLGELGIDLADDGLDAMLADCTPEEVEAAQIIRRMMAEA
ncbi:hypothetical protein KUV75_09500 [Qipengyuania gaetbuli]|uniref:hypothetical protein n=1 Tax=Qipengyuania gaetbuli TaxID=266952 RepID=UPI001C9A2A24|nr:hypothetical protein [Qipengyuania gaetbuli]MBY6015132.1 hypothetical protein [Qipengyuania gaetbuli]